MGLFEIALVVSALLCALVAGFVFAFATVVMPGVRGLNDRDFLRAFKTMDGVIQRNQWAFMLVWLGSILASLLAVLLSFRHPVGAERFLLVVAAALYLLGVQLPTATINVPLNNRLQRLDLESLSDADISVSRTRFEGRWIKWNLIRTVLAVLSSAMLIVVALRL